MDKQIYPRTIQELVYAGLIVVVLLIMFLGGLGAILHASDRQVIRADDLRQMVRQLQSYDAESEVVVYQLRHGRATSYYGSTYLDTLQSTAESLGEDLQTHTIDPSIAAQAGRTLQQAQEFSQTLQQVSDATSDADLQPIPDQLRAIGASLSRIEAAL